MEHVPDAPWIRDAELNGFGEDVPPVLCPVCYEECEEIYFYKEEEQNAIGCENCIDHMDAYDWKELHGGDNG